MLKLLLSVLLAILLLSYKNGFPPNHQPPGGGSSSSSVQSSSRASSSISSSSTSSVSSISSSSASSVDNSPSCATSNGVLFVDSICAGWALKIWESKTDNSAYSQSMESPGIMLTNTIADSGDLNHKSVIDIQYNATPDWSALPQFKPVVANNPSGVGVIDLSDYTTGKISFDIRVISNPNAAKMFARVECGWPCNSRENEINIPALNQWVHVEISVVDLIAQGLNLRNVDVALDISPEWGKQANSHLQIDNVRWEKGATTSMNCSTEGVVFVDGVCSSWRNTSYFEAAADNSVFYPEVYDGSTGNLITQKLIDSSDEGHNKVLDINFSANTNLNGYVRSQNPTSSPDGVDMSAFENGIYVFDIKLINLGNPNAEILSILECGWPCDTEQPIKNLKLNQWQTISYSVQSLINAGLDIKHVKTGFEINPSWGLQANTHYQIDNVRWIKTNEPITKIKCFGQHFNDPTFAYPVSLETSFSRINLMNSIWLPYLGVSAIINPQWNQISEKFRFIVQDQTGLLNSCVSNGFTKHGLVTGQVYLPASYVTDGKMYVWLALFDANKNLITETRQNISNLKANEWNTMTFDLTWIPNAITNAQYVGFEFEQNGKDPSVTGEIKIDNFVVLLDK